MAKLIQLDKNSCHELSIRLFITGLEFDKKTFYSLCEIKIFDELPLNFPTIPDNTPKGFIRSVLNNSKKTKQLQVFGDSIAFILTPNYFQKKINLKLALEEFGKDLKEIIAVLKKLKTKLTNFEEKILLMFELERDKRAPSVMATTFLNDKYNSLDYFSLKLITAKIKKIKLGSKNKKFVSTINLQSLKANQEPSVENAFALDYILNSAPFGLVSQTYNYNDVINFNNDFYKLLEDDTAKI